MSAARKRPAAAPAPRPGPENPWSLHRLVKEAFDASDGDADRTMERVLACLAQDDPPYAAIAAEALRRAVQDVVQGLLTDQRETFWEGDAPAAPLQLTPAQVAGWTPNLDLQRRMARFVGSLWEYRLGPNGKRLSAMTVDQARAVLPYYRAMRVRGTVVELWVTLMTQGKEGTARLADLYTEKEIREMKAQASEAATRMWAGGQA